MLITHLSNRVEPREINTLVPMPLTPGMGAGVFCGNGHKKSSGQLIAAA